MQKLQGLDTPHRARDHLRPPLPVRGRSLIHDFEDEVGSTSMRVSVFGLGYVGTVSMACLARDGHGVVGVDVDSRKVEHLRARRSPIIEVGIQELIETVCSTSRVKVTTEALTAIEESDVSFVCVGTPAQANGSQDLSALRRLAAEIGEAFKALDKRGHVVVIRSTVQPGTVEEVIRPLIEEHSGLVCGEDFFVCFQPEFLREGTSIQDYDNPPFTVVGADEEVSVRALKNLFGHLPCRFVQTSIRTAEMLKYACNAFHALKVTFANEIGRMAQAVAVDPHEVMRVLCMDERLNISPAYLRPGFAFGGSCLPKDLRALLYLAKGNDVELPMLANLLPSNRAHIEHAISLAASGGRCSIALLGLAFKSGTDDLRESPMVALAEHFIGKGMKLKVYDPEVNLSRLVGANRRFIEESIPHIATLMSADLADVISGCDIVITALRTPEVTQALAAHSRPDQLLIDFVGLPDGHGFKGRYRGICW